MKWLTKLNEVTENIRQHPNNANFRLEMVQYLCMLGDWERSLKQLEQFQKLFPQKDPILVHYLLNQIEAEVRRSGVLSANYKPLSLVQNDQLDQILIQQLSLLTWIIEDNIEYIISSFTQLSEGVPEYAATLSYFNNVKITEPWLMDGDARTAFVCEIFWHGQYCWLPWHIIHSITFQPPKSLLDTIWRGADILLCNGKRFQAVLPVRYGFITGTTYSDAQLACNETAWHKIIDDLHLGLGQKMLFGKQDEYSLLDLKEVVFEA